MNNILTKALEQTGSVIISGHVRPDGDCVGSCMGLYHYIKDNYPDISVDVRLESVPECYRLIPGTDYVITECDDEQTYDLFIALDCSDKKRLGDAVRYFDTASKTICIDHHFSNNHFADDNYVADKASSASEVLCTLLDTEKISYNAAFSFYIGIICDSGVFKYDSTSHLTMDIAGRLMEKGIPYTQLIDQVFYQKTYKQNKLLGRCLLSSFTEFEGKLVGSIVTREIFEEFDAGHEDLEGIIDQLRLTKGCEVALLVSVNPDLTQKFSLRSCNYVDVASIASVFGGGGHIRAAGFSSDQALDLTLDKVLKLVEEQL